MATFAALLRTYREASGLSQRALARAAQINPAIISRMESGDRGPSGPAQVRAIAEALALDEQGGDDLLTSAGFWPRVYLDLGPQDPSLLAVARTVAASAANPAYQQRFRRVLDLLCAQWQAQMERPQGTGEAPLSSEKRGSAR